jgi:hypothetical protein
MTRWMAGSASQAAPRLAIAGGGTLAPALAPAVSAVGQGAVAAAPEATAAILTGYIQSKAPNQFGAPKTGPLEGARGVEVRDPATGNLITDIDSVENGILWEEKSAGFATDATKWVNKHITGKFNSYMKARQQLPGYENAPIGFRFPGKPADPALEQAITNEVEALRQANPGVDIRLEW